MKRTRVQELLADARRANENHDCHDSYGVYRLINKHTPKVPICKLQIRNHRGLLASSQEEISILRSYVSEVWGRQTAIHVEPNQVHSMPFSAHALQQAIEGLPVTKAVALPFVPGAVLKTHAFIVSRWLYVFLEHHWLRPMPQILESWKDGWVCMLHKPRKTLSCPQNLRMLALMESLGKATAGLITRVALTQLVLCLTEFPQFAYLPNRSTMDCLVRVLKHCPHVHDTIHAYSAKVHVTVSGSPPPSLYGGAQLSSGRQSCFRLCESSHAL